MAGDNQMDPADLEAIAGPVARGEVDYAKANRLFTGTRLGDDATPRATWATPILSLLTKIASGYWHVADSQSGYTAIRRSDARASSTCDRIYPRYGFPNDMLVHLNVLNARVRDVPSRPVYGVGETSDIRSEAWCIPAISWLLTKALLLADAREVRDPGLPPARLLLRVRDPLSRSRPRARARRDGPSYPRQRAHGRDGRARRAAF